MEKLLIVGTFNFYQYEQVLADALEDYFIISTYKIPDPKLYRKILLFPTINKLFLKAVAEIKPNVIFFYRTNLISASTVKKIKMQNPQIKIIAYHNDNPYLNELTRRWKYYFFRSIIKYTDITYCYRSANLLPAIELGAKRSKLLLPHYCTKVHYPDAAVERQIDVLYIGHYEVDGREIFVDKMIKAGIEFKILGNWDEIAIKNRWPKRFFDKPVYGDTYRKTLASAKIGLCFLSTHNRDGYTRRCFEIPAINTLLLSQCTPELKELFIEDEEAVFFNDPEEMIYKIQKLLANPDDIVRIANAGRLKVLENFSEIVRARQIYDDIAAI